MMIDTKMLTMPREHAYKYMHLDVARMNQLARSHISILEIVMPPGDFGRRRGLIRFTPTDLPKFLPYR
jgi:hypothetical protein